MIKARHCRQRRPKSLDVNRLTSSITSATTPTLGCPTEINHFKSYEDSRYCFKFLAPVSSILLCLQFLFFYFVSCSEKKNVGIPHCYIFKLPQLVLVVSPLSASPFSTAPVVLRVPFHSKVISSLLVVVNCLPCPRTSTVCSSLLNLFL